MSSNVSVNTAESNDRPTRNPFETSPAKLLRTIKLPTSALGLDIASDSRTLYAACLDGGVYQLDSESDARERIGQHESFASGVVLTGDAGDRGHRLVSGGYDGVLQWHDAAAKKTLRKVGAHSFWSWQVAASKESGLVASAGGQYLCGGYKYEPRRSEEPPVKVHDIDSGRQVHALDHVPPVESVAFSSDGKHLAAGNLMGEVRVWESDTGKLASTWTTPSFTGWGIIKGHYYTGGIFSMTFTPGDRELLVAGMGTTRDPAAGNGRQLWQRFAWREDPARKIDETRRDESGTGLMETIVLHPSGGYFVMGGRIAKGKWNVAFFDTRTGRLLHSLTTKSRVTKAVFSPAGDRLYLAGAVGQGKPKDGKFAPYGRVGVYRVPRPGRLF